MHGRPGKSAKQSNPTVRPAGLWWLVMSECYALPAEMGGFPGPSPVTHLRVRFRTVSNPASAAIVHLTADFIGASAQQLGDQSLISGILVSAAGASGMKASGSPTVIAHPDGGLSVILPLDGCHMSVHTMPSRELAILDVIALPPHDPQRALDVIARRLTARSVVTDIRTRG